MFVDEPEPQDFRTAKNWVVFVRELIPRHGMDNGGRIGSLWIQVAFGVKTLTRALIRVASNPDQCADTLATRLACGKSC